jgi:hypothetical protein
MILMMYMCNQIHYEMIQLCSFVTTWIDGWITKAKGCGWEGESSNFTSDMSWAWCHHENLAWVQ